MSVSRLNAIELAKRTPISASWHRDYEDTNTVYVGGLPLEANEHDLLILMSQFGVPTACVLARDRESGESKGYAWITFEAWESCVWQLTIWIMNHAYYRGCVEDGQMGVWQRAVREELLAKDFVQEED
ncbi:hypothetical protein CAS74_002761 [Pichia kudriavzevii]|uniref:RRM domain-containing protein n=1 Tax=Pichia kudriavzevii TaxID=4909 RepID=A0A1Z8JMH1_PICKU|nr:hypothetical protein CAS74_002761 [Pichia kudriavzevii]